MANCVTSYWGNGYRAQRGEVCNDFIVASYPSKKTKPLACARHSVFIFVFQVTKIESTDRVTVQWVDGSESQFNVHPTGLSTPFQISWKNLQPKLRIIFELDLPNLESFTLFYLVHNITGYSSL